MQKIMLTLLLLTFSLSVSAQQATNVVISEFATRGLSGNASGEFVEIYNPTSVAIDISGWRLQYRSASGSAYNSLVRIADGSVIAGRSFFLIAGPTWAGTPSADVQWGGSGMADNGNIRIVDASSHEIDRVGYGSGNDPKGSPAPNHGTSANNNSVERKASVASTAASLASGGAEEFSGNGYDSGDNGSDFLKQMNGRNPQNTLSPQEPASADGSGTAYTTVDRLDALEEFKLPIIFKPSKQFEISDMKIVVPAGFSWSEDASDVEIGDLLQAEISTKGDTIYLDRLFFDADSAVITLKKQIAAPGTGVYSYNILTTGGVEFLPIQDPPSVFVSGGPIPIAEARRNNSQGVPEKIGEIVTVNGIVTVSDQFGAPGYIQDNSAGIAVYDFDFTEAVTIGDEVIITGVITQFNGLTELEQVTLDALPSQGNTVTPPVVSIPDILNDGQGGIEVYEGMLVRLNGVTVNTASWTVSGAGTNYKLSDGSHELAVRIDNNVDFAGSPAPGGSFDIIGVVSQYKRDAPFIGGYQLMPRMGSDILATGPRITSAPVETAISSTSITIEWGTAVAADSYIRYGLTNAFELGIVQASSGATGHTALLANLTPATIYHTQAFAVADGDTSVAQTLYVCSASAASTGEMLVYFNQSVDKSLYPPLPAKDNVNLLFKLLDRIDGAQYSIDLCLYSLSGRVGDDIADRLLAAKARGVSIRAIFETDNSNTNAMRTLRNNVPSITDNFDRINAGAGLMHNKFFIIDARDRSSDTDDYVTSGSWNPTDPGTDDDAQNLIVIQDQALATVYTAEFEEMWGSSTESPNSSESRFGARKLNNTPHRFNIVGTWTELYFSPSDQTTSHLVRAVANARHSVYFAVLTFTRDDLGRTMVDQHNAGILVRGLFDNDSDQGTEFPYLQSSGVDVHLKKGVRGFLHHKYMLVDADDGAAGAHPVVITGSHNWSNSAEFSNNENTLILHSGDIAVQYLQEWYKRYRDSGGEADIVLAVEQLSAIPIGMDILSVYPQPYTSGGSGLTVDISVDRSSPLTLSVHNVLGREVARLMEGHYVNGRYRVRFDGSSLPAGLYFLKLSDGVRNSGAKLIITK